MSGRRKLNGVSSPHPLAAGLPGIFQPVLERDEAQLLRALAAGERLAVADAERADDAQARLGLFDATPAEAAERAAEDDFLARLCEGFDGVLAPVFVTLDSLDVLVDPRLAPTDFLGWLGGFLSLRDRTDWPEASWRSLIAESARLYGRRGTATALRRTLELYTGGSVTVEETGGCVDGPGPVPPAGPPSLVVKIKDARRPSSDIAFQRGVDSVVVMAKPAHVPHRIVWEQA